jgi:hypothetical protein
LLSVSNNATCTTTFREFCDDLKLRLHQERKAKRRSTMEAYKALLTERG